MRLLSRVLGSMGYVTRILLCVMTPPGLLRPRTRLRNCSRPSTSPAPMASHRAGTSSLATSSYSITHRIHPKERQCIYSRSTQQYV